MSIGGADLYLAIYQLVPVSLIAVNGRAHVIYLINKVKLDCNLNQPKALQSQAVTVIAGSLLLE